TSRLLVGGGELTAFAARHDLFDRLHPAYGDGRGSEAVAWLNGTAAYSWSPNNDEHLLAFADKFVGDPRAVDDDTLRELKALLDPITGPRAIDIGRRLGAAILLDASDGRRGAVIRLVEPSKAYLSKAIDKDYPNWP